MIHEPEKGTFSVVDLTRLQEMSDGDREFEEEVLGVFLGDTRDRLQVLGNALVAGDVETTHHEAHTIKGACGNVGAWRLQALARELEMMDLSAQPEEAKEVYEEAGHAFEEVRSFIKTYLSS